MTMNTLRFVSIVFVATLAACSQTNQSHCANREGDQTCEQQDAGSHPVCSSCESANNGCVEASVELEGSCHADTVADTSTSTGSSPTTNDSLSSTTVATNPTTTTDPVTTMTTSEDTTTSESTTERETTEGETTTSSTMTSDPSASSSTGPEVLCPNDLIDDGEQCDGDNLQGETCDSRGLAGGVISCTDQCQLDLSQCEALPTCGDGMLAGEEQCDGDGNLSVANCQALSAVYGAGELTCTRNCTFDTSDCCVTTGYGCNRETNCCAGCFVVACL